MDMMHFRELRAEVFRLHSEQRYADALELLERKADRHPPIRRHLFWRGCLSALLERGWSDCVSAGGGGPGHWWSEYSLGRSDLNALHDDSQFGELVAICRTGMQRPNGEAELILLKPETAPPWPLLIALHGLGGSAREFVQHWQSVAAEGWLVAVAQSSQVVSPGCFGWRDQNRAVEEIRGHFETIARDCEVASDRVIIAGFSQGGSTAIRIGLSRLLPVTGVFGIACAPRDLDEVRQVIAISASREVRVYLVVGDKDYVFDRAVEFCELLRSSAIAAQLEVRPGLGHEVPKDINRSIAAGVEFLLR